MTSAQKGHALSLVRFQGRGGGRALSLGVQERPRHRFGEAGPGRLGAVMTCLFEIEGQQFLALNGGPQFSFNQAISLMVNCDTQEEVDELWEKLGAGGAPNRCGWLADKFGVPWQIAPRALPEVLQSGGAAATQRVMRAMFEMKKLDIARLRQAFGPNQEEEP